MVNYDGVLLIFKGLSNFRCFSANKRTNLFTFIPKLLNLINQGDIIRLDEYVTNFGVILLVKNDILKFHLYFNDNYYPSKIHILYNKN